MSRRESRNPPSLAVLETGLVHALAVLRENAEGAGVDGHPVDDALTTIETFFAVAMRVLRKTNPSKIRDAAMVQEIKARLDGADMLER